MSSDYKKTKQKSEEVFLENKLPYWLANDVAVRGIYDQIKKTLYAEGFKARLNVYLTKYSRKDNKFNDNDIMLMDIINRGMETKTTEEIKEDIKKQILSETDISGSTYQEKRYFWGKQRAFRWIYILLFIFLSLLLISSLFYNPISNNPTTTDAKTIYLMGIVIGWVFTLYKTIRINSYKMKFLKEEMKSDEPFIKEKKRRQIIILTILCLILLCLIVGVLIKKPFVIF
jgi:hypothetical protein